MNLKSLLTATAVAALLCAPIAQAQQATFPTVSGSSISTPVSVPNGGSGNTSLAVGSLNTGNGTGAYVSVAPAASGTVLTSNGSGVAPSYQTVPAGTGRLYKLGFASAVNMASVADTAFSISLSSKYIISEYIVSNCTSPPGAATGGFFSAVGATGNAYFINSTYTQATIPAVALVIQPYGVGNSSGTRGYIQTAPATVYFHISTANASALACDITLMGEDLS